MRSSNNYSPDNRNNETLTRKMMESSGGSFALGAMTFNAETSGTITKGFGNTKRSKKASVSREGRDNVVTNIKIKTNDF